MNRGKFIALEGGEGAGKSTQARLLAEALRARGQACAITREPGGTAGAEAIRALLLGTEGEGWHPRAEALLFAAARSDHVERLIVPALERGEWVICDRFVDSSRAYQGGGGGLSDADVLDLHRIGGRDASYHAAVAAAFRRFADAEPARFARIGGDGSPDQVHAVVMDVLEPILP
ncbi:MAG: dTMP kinase [Pseudomonadota bacterium]